MRRPLLVPALLVLLVMAALPAFFPAAVAAGDFVSHDLDSDPRALASSQREWTREEMLAATPMPMPKAFGAAVGAAPPRPAGALPGLVSGDPGTGRIDEFIDPEQIERAPSGGYGYPAPFSRYQNTASYTKFPYRAVGKLFFQQGGGSYVCSASVIGPSQIWTAGHCIADGSGTWSSNIVFVPAYKDGSAPYGQWTASATGAMSSWVNGGGQDFSQDYAGAVIRKKNGVGVGQRVGFLGFSWNQDTVHWTSIGYPAAAPFSGMRMNICAASYAYSATDQPLPYPVAMGCDMTGGCSGGPWIKDFQRGNYLNGDNSYRRCTDPQCAGTMDQELFSPYFDDNTKSFFDWLRANLP